MVGDFKINSSNFQMSQDNPMENSNPANESVSAAEEKRHVELWREIIEADKSSSTGKEDVNCGKSVAKSNDFATADYNYHSIFRESEEENDEEQEIGTLMLCEDCKINEVSKVERELGKYLCEDCINNYK